MQGKLTLAQSENLLFSTPDPLNTVLCLTLARIYTLIHITHKQLPYGHLSDPDVCIFERTELHRPWTKNLGMDFPDLEYPLYCQKGEGKEEEE